MKTILKILLITTSVHAAPITEDEEVIRYYESDLAEYGHHFEGDMVLNEEQEKRIQQNLVVVNGRNGLVDEIYRWRNNIVNYELSSAFDDDHIRAIEAALHRIEDKTCVRFKRKSSKFVRDYVFVTAHPSGCYSEIGRQGGKQLLNLALHQVGFGCFKSGSIMHEFIHALGFYHQQSAPDRDNYIKVHFENVVPGHDMNFQKYSINDLTQFGVKYDYESIMHYTTNAFSKNGLPTMTPLQNVPIGQRTHLSPGDIAKINLMYKCHQ